MSCKEVPDAWWLPGNLLRAASAAKGASRDATSTGDGLRAAGGRQHVVEQCGSILLPTRANIMSGNTILLKAFMFFMSGTVSDLVIPTVETWRRQNIASCRQNIMSGKHNIMSSAAFYYEWSVCENRPKNIGTVSCVFFLLWVACILTMSGFPAIN